jgi:hypothetical protein
VTLDEEDPLFDVTWVHVFEQDGAQGAVYLPESDPIPLSRRPRERLELDPDGSARLLTPGPGDGYVEQPASWREDDDTIVVRTRRGVELCIVDRSPSRLVIQTRQKR